MAERSSPYRRIAGHGTGLVAHARLYQAPDHFLQVSSTGFSETYKRFYFRDIQAIILENKPWRLWWSCGLGMLLLLFLAPASMTTGVPAAVLRMLHSHRRSNRAASRFDPNSNRTHLHDASGGFGCPISATRHVESNRRRRVVCATGGTLRTV
jgi:hypothetical protein